MSFYVEHNFSPTEKQINFAIIYKLILNIYTQGHEILNNEDIIPFQNKVSNIFWFKVNTFYILNVFIYNKCIFNVELLYNCVTLR